MNSILIETPGATPLQHLCLRPCEENRCTGVVRYRSSRRYGCIDPSGDNSLSPMTWDGNIVKSAGRTTPWVGPSRYVPPLKLLKGTGQEKVYGC